MTISGAASVFRWTNLLQNYYETGYIQKEDEKELKYFRNMTGKINRYFCQFLELLQNPFDLGSCCEHPEIVTLDGIVLSIESAKIRKRNLQTPWVCGESKKRSVVLSID
jgi:hypothetical protein